jgi:DNA-binding transcriptional MerR regulator
MDQSEGRMLTTGGLAEAGDCEPQTVRKYDKLGLLKPAARDNAGRRLYAPSQVLVLKEIIAARIANRGFGRGRPARAD